MTHFLICPNFISTGKAKQMEDKMVQKLQEDVDMGDEDLWSHKQSHLCVELLSKFNVFHFVFLFWNQISVRLITGT